MGTGSPARRSVGRLEQEVFAAVAAGQDEGVTAAEIAAVLDPTPAHTTVVSTLTRLLARRVVSRHRVGRTMHYTATGDSAAVVATSTAQRMLRALAATPDRSGALEQFVGQLHPDDEATLTRLLATPHLVQPEPRPDLRHQPWGRSDHPWATPQHGRGEDHRVERATTVTPAGRSPGGDTEARRSARDAVPRPRSVRLEPARTPLGS